MIIDRAFGVVSVARNLLNQFAICLENSRIGIGKMNALGMISQCLMAHAARNCVTFLILHQEPNAVLFQVLVLEALERHLHYLTSIMTLPLDTVLGPLWFSLVIRLGLRNLVQVAGTLPLC